MGWIKKTSCIVVGSAVVLAVSGAFLALFLRQEKAHVFFEVRGTYARAKVLDSWRTDQSLVRLVALHNDRDEIVTTAYIRRPLCPSDDYHILLSYAGLKTGKRILNLFPEQPDLILVAVQYPYMRPWRVNDYLRWPHDIRQSVYRTVAGGMLAVSFLSETERLDTERLTVIGASLGSTFASLHGALDERVPRIILAHGGGDFPLVIRTIEQRSGRPWLGALKAAIADVLVGTFDPIHYVDRISPREFIIIATRKDKYYPVESIEALYRRAREPKTIIWTETSHVSSRRREVIDDIVRRIAPYLTGHDYFQLSDQAHRSHPEP